MKELFHDGQLKLKKPDDMNPEATLIKIILESISKLDEKPSLELHASYAKVCRALHKKWLADSEIPIKLPEQIQYYSIGRIMQIKPYSKENREV